MTKPVCPNCKKLDRGALLPSDHGGQFFFTRCGNCNHGYSYNSKGEIARGHEERSASKEQLHAMIVDDMSRFLIVELPGPATHVERCEIAQRIAGVLAPEPLLSQSAELCAVGEWVDAMTPSPTAQALEALEMVTRHFWEATPLDGKVWQEHEVAKFVNEAIDRLRGSAAEPPSANPFQDRVAKWMVATFDADTVSNKNERNHRFLEESLELVQSLGCTRAEAHMLVDYVYGRPVGEPRQETGGVMVTLAALGNAADINVIDAAETELARCWTKIEQIRTKQAAKPRHSPLPGPSEPPGVWRSVATDPPSEWTLVLAYRPGPNQTHFIGQWYRHNDGRLLWELNGRTGYGVEPPILWAPFPGLPSTKEPAPEASILKAFERSPRRVPDEIERLEFAPPADPVVDDGEEFGADDVCDTSDETGDGHG